MYYKDHNIFFEKLLRDYYPATNEEVGMFTYMSQ